MDNQQQQRMKVAAQQFTDALVAAYRASSDRTVVAQELGAQQIEYFFNTVINNLRTQAEGTLQTTQQLATQQKRIQEATRELTQASTDNYMDLLDSVFAFYQGGTSKIQRRIEQVEEARRRAEEAERGRSKAERQTEEAKRSTGELQRRVEKAERSLEEAKGQTEQAQQRAEEAERQVEQAQGRSQETERSLEEAQRRTLEAQRGAEEAERKRSRSEAESRVGDEEGVTKADAVGHPLSTWVRTSGRSKVRGRNTGSQGGTFGQGGDVREKVGSSSPLTTRGRKVPG